MEFCLQKLLIVWQKLSMKIKSRLTLHFEFDLLYLHNWCKKTLIFGEIALLLTNNIETGLKTQNVEKLSLDLICIDNFCQNIKF